MILSEDSKTLFCSSKFPWTRERISSKFVHNWGTRPQKGSSALPWYIQLQLKMKNPFTSEL